MTLSRRINLILETFATCERRHPCLKAVSLADMTSYHLSRDHGLCVTPDEVLRALAQSAEPVEGPL